MTCIEFSPLNPIAGGIPPTPLRCAPAGDDRRNGARQDREIEGQRPALDVRHVEPHLAVEIDLVAPGHLPETGETRNRRESTALPRVVASHFRTDRRLPA